MSKKYLTLEEAAAQLGMPNEELIRLRSRGDIRGFADRGTWKFNPEDVVALQRKMQADSSPEVPLFDDSSADMNLLIDDDSQPEMLTGSDSDVRLVGEPEMLLGLDSDSDVKLVGLGQSVSEGLGAGTDADIPLFDEGSDSDVKLIRPDSDSDVKLPGDSDSDVKLVGGATDADLQMMSDSDINLIPDPKTSGEVNLIPDRGSVIDEDSGISLAADSSLMLGAESGINLEGPTDSGIALDESMDDEGITLALDEDSGISLDIGESGISLESLGESGISLEDDSIGGGTIPMMDALSDDKVAETQFEMAALDDSNFDLGTSDDATGVLDQKAVAAMDDAAFDLDDGAVEEVVDEVDLDGGAFDAEEDLDVFDADDDVFAGSESEAGFATSSSRKMVAAEQDWGTPTFVGLVLASLLMLAVGAVMLDLVKNISTAAPPNPASTTVIGIISGLYK